mmetsp:Transcript_38034/g.88955  ORF Transcript_38034/g.88955 Transcript_38034/m.88955 type:complete len:246 (-) Transcript_38034:1571-2308(-)
MHDCCSELQIEVALHTLLGDGLGNSLGDASLKLTSKQVPKPSFQKWDDTPQEEEPHTPSWRPEAASRPLAHGTRVEAVVDEVLQILAHSHLSHQSVLVSVHTGELTHVGVDVLQAIRQLVSIDVAQAELHVTVHDQLGQAHDLSAQVERIAEPGLLTLLCGQGLHWLQVEVVIQVQEVEVLARNQQIQHVVALTTHLQADLHPVELGSLEELRCCKDVHEIPLVEGLWWAVVQLVQHPHLQELLV